MRPKLSARILATCFLALSASAADLAGRVELSTKGGARLKGEEMQDVVVSYQPVGKTALHPTKNAAVYTRGKAFVPRVLAVTAGTEVRFPNEDPILHDVFSVTSGSAFDSGLHGKGEAPSRVFNKPGVVRLFCNVHHRMVAHVVVLDTPFFTVPAADGSFSLADLPDGPGRLSAWHPGAEPVSIELTRPAAELPPLSLLVVQQRVPPHLNKLGEPYGKATGSAYDE